MPDAGLLLMSWKLNLESAVSFYVVSEFVISEIELGFAWFS